MDGAIPIYLGGENQESIYKRIEEYYEDIIERQPQEKVLGDDDLTLEQIYVPLETEEGESLEDWVKRKLEEKSNRVLVIMGAPGRGKTVFSRLFSFRVRRDLHPLWIPIWIRLRDIDDFKANLTDTLEPTIKELGQNWLKNEKQRYLIFLDGFDELRMEGRVFGVQKFLDQIVRFQERTPHQIILTGRPLAFQDLTYPKEETTIASMNSALQGKWLEKWELVVGEEEVAKFRGFLTHCPQTVQKELAPEPLLLYLLAVMHRDGNIKRETFQNQGEMGAKIQIYNQSIQWVLTKQRDEYEQKKIVGLTPPELEQVLMSAGICVIQSGGEYCTIKAVIERLEKFDQKIADSMSKIAQGKEEDNLKNALAAFYLKSADTGAVEFFHKSFSEFFCAKAMEQCFLESPQPKEIYDLLGYGNLTREIVDYLFGLLGENQGFEPEELFTTLEDFYHKWCEGEYIDVFPEEGKENYPLWKMGKLRQNPILGKKTFLGLRQVDIYTGLNVLILLLELQRYGKKQDLELSFHLCGKVNKEGIPKDKDKLSRIINYSESLGNATFSRIVGAFLSGANLYHANLYQANLYNANLDSADLINANLYNANLDNANLQYANLYSANLKGIKWNEETKWWGVRGLESAINVLPELMRMRERSAVADPVFHPGSP